MTIEKWDHLINNPYFATAGKIAAVGAVGIGLYQIIKRLPKSEPLNPVQPDAFNIVYGDILSHLDSKSGHYPSSLIRKGAQALLMAFYEESSGVDLTALSRALYSLRDLAVSASGLQETLNAGKGVLTAIEGQDLSAMKQREIIAQLSQLQAIPTFVREQVDASYRRYLDKNGYTVTHPDREDWREIEKLLPDLKSRLTVTEANYISKHHPRLGWLVVKRKTNIGAELMGCVQYTSIGHIPDNLSEAKPEDFGQEVEYKDHTLLVTNMAIKQDTVKDAKAALLFGLRDLVRFNKAKSALMAFTPTQKSNYSITENDIIQNDDIMDILFFGDLELNNGLPLNHRFYSRLNLPVIFATLAVKDYMVDASARGLTLYRR